MAPYACFASCASSFRRHRRHLGGRRGFVFSRSGQRVVRFDPEHDALEFHAAHEEAFADHWEYTPRAFEPWAKEYLESARFDTTLWSVVRAGTEIAAGTICAGDTYGGGWIHACSRVAGGAGRAWRRRCFASRSC